jgi:hypothetical protein
MFPVHYSRYMERDFLFSYSPVFSSDGFIFPRYDAGSLCVDPNVLMNWVPSYSRVETFLPLNMKTVHSQDISVSYYPLTQHQIPQEQNLQLYHCRNCKTRIYRFFCLYSWSKNWVLTSVRLPSLRMHGILRELSTQLHDVMFTHRKKIHRNFIHLS